MLILVDGLLKIGHFGLYCSHVDLAGAITAQRHGAYGSWKCTHGRWWRSCHHFLVIISASNVALVLRGRCGPTRPSQFDVCWGPSSSDTHKRQTSLRRIVYQHVTTLWCWQRLGDLCPAKPWTSCFCSDASLRRLPELVWSECGHISIQSSLQPERAWSHLEILSWCTWK